MPKGVPEDVYVVDPTFVPDAVSLVGNIRTDGTGDEHRLGQHPVFVEARERNAIVAARALDPASPVDRGLVILPGGHGGQIGNPDTDDEARERIASTARLLAASKPEVVTPDLRDGEPLVPDLPLPEEVKTDADVEADVEADKTPQKAPARPATTRRTSAAAK